jgi:hypothetical protein
MAVVARQTKAGWLSGGRNRGWRANKKRRGLDSQTAGTSVQPTALGNELDSSGRSGVHWVRQFRFLRTRAISSTNSSGSGSATPRLFPALFTRALIVRTSWDVYFSALLGWWM